MIIHNYNTNYTLIAPGEAAGVFTILMSQQKFDIAIYIYLLYYSYIYSALH